MACHGDSLLSAGAGALRRFNSLGRSQSGLDASLATEIYFARRGPERSRRWRATEIHFARPEPERKAAEIYFARPEPEWS
uniref:Uncharacterized protein n=1 Tax=Oryza glumipatula TaxID=40148 RepID=A0A0D9Y5L5_9ORYZ